jgi:hypothetical protein
MAQSPEQRSRSGKLHVLIDSLIRQGFCADEIAERAGCSTNVVYKNMKKFRVGSCERISPLGRKAGEIAKAADFLARVGPNAFATCPNGHGHYRRIVKAGELFLKLSCGCVKRDKAPVNEMRLKASEIG